MFTKYITGEENSNGVKINKTPWNDDMLNKETGLIAEHLAKVQGDHYSTGQFLHYEGKTCLLLKIICGIHSPSTYRFSEQ